MFKFSRDSVEATVPVLITICGNEVLKAPSSPNIERVTISKTNPTTTQIDYQSQIPFISGYTFCKKITTLEIFDETGIRQLTHSSIRIEAGNPPTISITNNFTEPELKFKLKATTYGGVSQTIDYVYVDI